MTNTTRHCPHVDRTAVLGSVTMKKMNSWYIGPVIGATLASHGVPVSAVRTNENSRNEATYAAEIWARPTRHTMTEPSTQITAIGATTLPHWMLRTVIVAGARKTAALTPK